MAKGLTNDYLESTCKKIIGPSFIGVYPCDVHPKVRKKKFSVIFNTGDQYSTGEHFVALSISNKKVFYFDPFGEKPTNHDILSFISKLNLALAWNTKKIQHESSSFCGFYCLAYLYSVKKKIPYSRFKNLFRTHDLKKNDKTVIKFLTK